MGENKIERALGIAWRYGQIDGSHHKAWVIDQMVRALFDDNNAYKEWVRLYETPMGFNESYEWDIGIAP